MFQYQNVLVSKIKPMLTSCMDIISDLKHNKGGNELKFYENFLAEDNVYQGIELTKEHSIEEIEEAILSFIDEVIKNLKYCFPDEALNILSSFNEILNPKSYPSNIKDLKKFGHDELNVLIAKYCVGASPLTEADSLKNDFTHFKQITKNFHSYEMKDYITKLATEYKDDFPRFSKLAEIDGVIPISASHTKHGFSCMKQIKTSQRSSLKEERIKDLMMLSLEGPLLNESKNIDSRNKKFFEKKRDGGSKF